MLFSFKLNIINLNLGVGNDILYTLYLQQFKWKQPQWLGSRGSYTEVQGWIIGLEVTFSSYLNYFTFLNFLVVLISSPPTPFFLLATVHQFICFVNLISFVFPKVIPYVNLIYFSKTYLPWLVTNMQVLAKSRILVSQFHVQRRRRRRKRSLLLHLLQRPLQFWSFCSYFVLGLSIKGKHEVCLSLLSGSIIVITIHSVQVFYYRSKTQSKLLV